MCAWVIMKGRLRNVGLEGVEGCFVVRVGNGFGAGWRVGGYGRGCGIDFGELFWVFNRAVLGFLEG